MAHPDLLLTGKHTTELAAQQQKLVSLEVGRLEAEYSALEGQQLGIRLNFQRLAHAHGLPIDAASKPYRANDQADRAHWYKIGARASSALGVLVFSLLSVLSLSVSINGLALFVGSCLVGMLLALVIDAGVCLATGASAGNPASERRILRFAKVSGVFAIGSAAAFMLLRFVDDAHAQSFVSIILVMFEASIFLLGGSLEAAQLLYTWSARLAENYQTIEERILQIEQRLGVIRTETGGIKAREGDGVLPEGGVTHEVRQQVDSIVPVDVVRSGAARRAHVNGVDRS